MSDDVRLLTRTQIASFIKDQRTLRAFEQLTSNVSQNIPASFADVYSKIEELLIEAGIADTKSSQAIDAINRLSNAIEMAALSPNKEQSAVDYLDINQSYMPAWKEGRLFYDKWAHSLAYYNDDENVTVNIGREGLVRVYNNTGAEIPNGKAVFITGADTGFPTAAMVSAATIDSQGVLGISTESIANGKHGYICTTGLVHDLDMSSYSVGDILYLSPTTAGELTDVRPIQPNYVVEMALVTDNDTTVGALFVRVQKLEWFPNLEIVLTAASTILPTTPTVIKPDATIRSEGVTYDSSTGIITFNQSQNYTVAFLINATPSAANKNIYFFFDENYGSGWVPKLYSGRQLNLPNSTETQVPAVISRYYEVGTQLRFQVWGDSTITLVTSDLPGTTAGTVKKPAFRVTIA